MYLQKASISCYDVDSVTLCQSTAHETPQCVVGSQSLPLHTPKCLPVLNLAPHKRVSQSGCDGEQYVGVCNQFAAVHVALARVTVGESLQAPGAQMTATAADYCAVGLPATL